MTLSEPGDVDVVVVGGGPAGLSAALVLAQGRRSVLVMADGPVRNARASAVHGLLGRDGVSPEEHISAGRGEAVAAGAVVLNTVATQLRLDPEGGGLRVQTGDGEERTAVHAVLATGVRDVLPEVPGLDELWGRDVHRCPFCHGPDVIDRSLTVLGVDEGSVHQALVVRQWSSDVVYVTHDAPPSPAQHRLLLARGVRVVQAHAASLERGPTGRLRGVRLHPVQDGTGRAPAWLPSAAVFVMTGLRPRTELAEQAGCRVGDDGFVVTDAVGRTSASGVWAVGNLRDPHAQVVDAQASGSRAAMMIDAALRERDLRAAMSAPG